MPRCYLALGGNVGDVDETLRWAVTRLAREGPVSITRVSPLVRTRPVGPNAGGEFTNAAAEIETDLEPLDLLDRLQDLERRAGRTPGKFWGPRPLDLDLIFYDDQTVDLPRLQVPHPASWYRRFVLDPLNEIASDVRHPLKGLTVGQLRARLLERPLRLALAGTSQTERQRVRQALCSTTTDVDVADWHPEGSPEAEPTFISWLGPHDAYSVEASLEFDRLPLVPRLDASAAAEKVAFLQGVLEAAKG